MQAEEILIGCFVECQSIKKVGGRRSVEELYQALFFVSPVPPERFTERNENRAWSQVSRKPTEISSKFSRYEKEKFKFGVRNFGSRDAAYDYLSDTHHTQIIDWKRSVRHKSLWGTERLGPQTSKHCLANEWISTPVNPTDVSFVFQNSREILRYKIVLGRVRTKTTVALPLRNSSWKQWISWEISWSNFSVFVYLQVELRLHYL